MWGEGIVGESFPVREDMYSWERLFLGEKSKLFLKGEELEAIFCDDESWAWVLLSEFGEDEAFAIIDEVTQGNFTLIFCFIGERELQSVHAELILVVKILPISLS